MSNRLAVVKPLESEIQRAILDYCAAERIFVHRRNVGAMKDGAGNYIRFNKRGMADLWGIRRTDGRHWECEVKRPGEEPTEEQRDWLASCGLRDAIVFWVTSIEEFIECAQFHRL